MSHVATAMKGGTAPRVSAVLPHRRSSVPSSGSGRLGGLSGVHHHPSHRQPRFARGGLQAARAYDIGKDLQPGGNSTTTTPSGWATMSNFLKASEGFASISAEEAEVLVEGGVKLIDVRPAPKYEEENIEGSYNVPLYQPITGWNAKKAARRAGFALFGVLNGTEENPNFYEDVEKVAGKDETIVIMCGEGGSLEPMKSDPSGRQSRSLIAAYCLLKNGWKKVYHMSKGFYYLDLDGDEEGEE
mmetsp:Transcript_2654/g.8976  ORF Transcript_2654/g.8976 Transcript_2654/m.8976 type:complete len:243 (+) Transcript_2654:115-843(+)|eukprot:CAMPEP_0182866834 /NCGR_PEP_ID=MMETSP0034_2-20130328/8404_1 /TAXON_ID=156128 /ORGANISM="Nephroselmis pyriformis, Strain CCMP717" /LENGTH=242 /DNA_ID=CAMNT_0024999167 /DNA_START=115 /DNA_END=843 /DNA_ORIENTATION=-